MQTASQLLQHTATYRQQSHKNDITYTTSMFGLNQLAVIDLWTKPYVGGTTVRCLEGHFGR